MEVERKSSSDDARGDLLSEIRKGFQLKPATVSENEKSRVKVNLPAFYVIQKIIYLLKVVHTKN